MQVIGGLSSNDLHSFMKEVFSLKQTSPKAVLKWIALRVPELIASGALIFAITLTAVNAFTRYCLHYTINGSDELICIAFSWLVFPGAAAAFRRRMHYGVDLLVNLFPRRVQAVAGVVTQLLIAVVLWVLTYLSYVLWLNVGTKIMTATRISYQVLDAGMLVGFALMAVYAVVFLIRDLRALPRKLQQRGSAA